MTAENIIFYLDVASKFVKKNDLSKALEIFLSEKRKVNTDSKFSLFYFNSKGEPVIINDLQDAKMIEKRLDEEWKERQTDGSFFENGLFFCLSELAAKAQKIEATYRVIVLSDIPSNRNADYTEALMGLVESVRNFPTFIDIIRIGNARIYKDDVKLRLISTLTNGGLFYVDNPKALQSTMRGLVKNKSLPDLGTEGSQIIDADKKKYWVNLAVAMIPATSGTQYQCGLCIGVTCPYCNSKDDFPLLCPNCSMTMHECCAAMHTWKKNVGLKHIFRCPRCGLLLKMDEKRVFEINQTPFEDEMAEIKTGETEEESKNESEETWTPPAEKVEYNQEAKYVKAEASPAPSTSSATTQLLGTETKNEAAKPIEKDLGKGVVMQMGLFGPKFIKKSTGETPAAEQKTSIPEHPTQPVAQAPKSAPAQESALEARRKKRLEAGGDQVVLCPVCAKYIKKTPNLTTCPFCGSPIF